MPIKRFWFDTETTGLKPWRHSIHQLHILVEIDGVVVETLDIKMRPNPKAEIDAEALKISGVTEEKINCYPWSQADGHKMVVDLLRKYVSQYDKKDKFHVFGFNNAGFDNPFLQGLFKQNNDDYYFAWFWVNSIDVMVLAADYLETTRHTIKDFKLKTVAAHLGIFVDEGRLHEAGYDIFLTREIYYKIKGPHVQTSTTN